MEKTRIFSEQNLKLAAQLHSPSEGPGRVKEVGFPKSKHPLKVVFQVPQPLLPRLGQAPPALGPQPAESRPRALHKNRRAYGIFRENRRAYGIFREKCAGPRLLSRKLRPAPGVRGAPAGAAAHPRPQLLPPRAPATPAAFCARAVAYFVSSSVPGPPDRAAGAEAATTRTKPLKKL